MFKLTPKLKRLDMPVQSILRLQRSLGDVQTAFPGWPSQRATAYVCAFSTEKGARVAVAFHMKESSDLVFYLNDEGDVARNDLSKVFTDGVYFAESLGFMLGDVNLNLPEGEREALWTSQPIFAPPVKVVAPPTVAAEPPPAPVADSRPVNGAGAKTGTSVVAKPAAKPTAKSSTKETPSEPVPDAAKPSTPPIPEGSLRPKAPVAVAPEKPRNVDLDLGLPRRAPLVALRRRKEPPSAEELEQKRKRLLENLGRFLASM